MKRLVLGVVCAAVLLGTLLAWAVRSVDLGSPSATGTSSAPGPDFVDERPPTPAPSPTSVNWPFRIVETSDPDSYASSIAGVVFGLDTTYADAADYRALLMSEADPQMTARGVADLERIVSGRIPEPGFWARMRANEQWSQWQTEQVWQPGAWDDVVTSGRAEPGWVVRNVLGIQTTHFRENGTAQTTSRERTITIGMRCPAAGAEVDRCRLALVGIGVVS